MNEQEVKKQTAEEESTINLVILFHDFVRGCRKYILLLPILCVIFAVAFTVYKSKNYIPMYMSKASFTVTTEEAIDENYGYWFYYDESTASQMALSFPYILESDILTDLIKQDLGTEYINGIISASAVPDSNLFTLTVSSANAKDAKVILDSVIKNYPTVSAYVIGNTKLNMIEAPQLATAPFNVQSKARYIMLGMMAGVAVWLVIMAIYAVLRKTIRSEDEIRNVLGLSCLGNIPNVIFKKRSSQTATVVSIHNKKVGEFFSESIRNLALSVAKELDGIGGRIVTFSSTLSGEGVSVTAQNVAYALSEQNKSVLLIKTAGKPYDENKKTMLEFLNGECTLEDILIHDEKSGIWEIYASGGLRECENSASSISISDCIKGLSENVDIVIIDSHSSERMGEVSVALMASDAVVYVIKQDYAKVRRIMEGIEDICSYSSKLLGCVITGTQTGLSGYGYGKYGGYYYHRYSYYRYGYGERNSDAKKETV